MIFFDKDLDEIVIKNYSGSIDGEEHAHIDQVVRKLKSNPKLNFFREGDNNAYVKGAVFYQEKCNNTIIISPSSSNKLVDVKDAFIFIEGNRISIYPIFNMLGVLDIGKKILFNSEIKYNIPQSVFNRERIYKKNLKDLTKIINSIYGLDIQNIFSISSGRALNGLYKVTDKNLREFILKFKGRDQEKAEKIARLTSAIPKFFSSPIYRRDGTGFTFDLNGEIYGLEEFISNNSPKDRNLEYFNQLGLIISELHLTFHNFLRNNKNGDLSFLSNERYTSESNLISFYLDLFINERRDNPLLSELEKIILMDPPKKLNSLKRILIHRDLNYSNILWTENAPRIIDSETITIAPRIKEFESPLLLEGNMKKPQYVSKSFKTIIRGYDKKNNPPISNEEREILFMLLKYSLVRNFVVRKIRRGNPDQNYLENILKNLNALENDK